MSHLNAAITAKSTFVTTPSLFINAEHLLTQPLCQSGSLLKHEERPPSRIEYFMSSGAGLSPGDRRDVVPLSSSLIAQALDRSPDGGVTLVLSKLNLSDVSAGAAEELATIGRVEPEDESVVERFVVILAIPNKPHPLALM